jgi:hypothetical protein
MSEFAGILPPDRLAEPGVVEGPIGSTVGMGRTQAATVAVMSR